MKKSLEPKVSLIITSYHANLALRMLTENCIDSLKYGRPDEVILVDDDSPIDYTPPDGIIHIKRDTNGGFPKCANTGFKAATGDILILSNNDVEYTPGWLEGILKPLNEGYDISSVRMSDADGYSTEDVITEGDWFGSLWAMKREVYEKLGGFDESFHKGTFEDKDYHMRALAAGFKIGKNHGALVEHVGRATMDTVYPNQENFYENRELYRSKYGRVD